MDLDRKFWGRMLIRMRSITPHGVTTFALGLAVAVLIYLLLKAPALPPLSSSDSASDWVSALAAAVAAVATIVIGRFAHQFTKEAEEGRAIEARKQKRRIHETIVARLRVLRNTARRAQYPVEAMERLFAAIAGDGQANRGEALPGFEPMTNEVRRERLAVVLQLEMTERYLDSISWSDEFKTTLDAACIDALFELEKKVLWYRTVISLKIKELRSQEERGGHEAGAYDAAQDAHLLGIRQIARDLAGAAATFMVALDERIAVFIVD